MCRRQRPGIHQTAQRQARQSQLLHGLGLWHAAYAKGLHRGQKPLRLWFETSHRAHAVGQQQQPLRPAAGQVLHQVLDRGLHAVAAGLAGHHDAVGRVQPLLWRWAS